MQFIYFFIMVALVITRRHIISAWQQIHQPPHNFRTRTHHLVHHLSTLSSQSNIQTTGRRNLQFHSLLFSSTSSESDVQTVSANKPSSRSTKYPPPPDPSTFPPWSYEPRDFFHFEILHESTKSLARVGRIHTPHGTIDTPSYVAVATNAALKAVDFRSAAGQDVHRR